jgi:hypothetical protein
VIRRILHKIISKPTEISSGPSSGKVPGTGTFLILLPWLDEGRIVAAKYHSVGCGDCGRTGEAVVAREQAAKLAPTDPTPRGELARLCPLR